MEFNLQKQFILSVFKDKDICSNGIAQLEFAEQIQAVIDYFKDNHIFSLKTGLISTEILKEIELLKTFAARDCYFGQKGNLSPSSDALFIDCSITKITITKAVKYLYFKNTSVENIYINGSVKLMQLYDKVTVKNISLNSTAEIDVLRLTNSTIKLLRLDTGAVIKTVRRATKTINEVIGGEGIKNIQSG